MRRKVRKWVKRQPWWLKAAVLIAIPVAALNLLVAWLGNTDIFVLSPFHLKDKAKAVKEYAEHRPACLFQSHEDLETAVDAASRQHHLPPGLLAAVVAVESGGHAHRISPTGAMGPGQLMPDTAKQMKVDDPFDEKDAIDGSARYLAQQLARYHDVRLALAAYNAGPGNVGKTVPRNGETEFYVRKVMAEYERRRPAPPKPVKKRTENARRSRQHH